METLDFVTFFWRVMHVFNLAELKFLSSLWWVTTEISVLIFSFWSSNLYLCSFGVT